MRYSKRLTQSSLFLLAATVLSACTPDKSIDPEESARLILPVAQVKREIAKVAPGNRTGEQIYNGACKACHEAGVSGAPKKGDSAAWGPRIARGLDSLVKTATEGKGAMPAKGGVADLTPEELTRAVVFIANAGGGKFTAPEVQK